MTNPRVSQFIDVAVVGGSANPRVSELADIAVVAGTDKPRISQLVCISVVANNKDYIPLGPVIGLGCWSPCGMLAHRWHWLEGKFQDAS